MHFAATIVVGCTRCEDPVIGAISHGHARVLAVIKADSQVAGVTSEDFAIGGDIGEESVEVACGYPIQCGYCRIGWYDVAVKIVVGSGKTIDIGGVRLADVVAEDRKVKIGRATRFLGADPK